MKILDNTLRDGEQMPGVVFSKEQKIELAGMFCRFGVDYVDVMPATSESEKELASKLIDSGMRDTLVASTLMRKDHIDLAESLGFLNIALFTSLSDVHLEKKLYMTRTDNLDLCRKNVIYAKEKGLNIMFAGEDSSRADITYVIDFINSLDGLIDYFFPCDTLGILTTDQSYNLIDRIKKESNAKIGLHFHNDFGQATANTLAGICAGGDLLSGTFNGIGERAGNASIEEVVLALKYQYDKELDLDYKLIGKICSLVEEYSKIHLQKNKPISGENAFSHESGTHVDGIIKDPINYEFLDPKKIGRERRLLFGKHSGTSGLRYLFGKKYNDEQYFRMLLEIKNKSEQEKKTYSEEEIKLMYG